MRLRRLPPILLLTLALCSASSGAPIPQLKDRNSNGHFDIEQQLPVYNSPVKTDAHGIDHAGGVHIAHTEDFEAPTNRLGAQGVLPHSGQAVLEQTDLVFNGRDEATRLEIKRRHVSRTNQRSSIFGPAWAFNYRHYFVQQEDGDLKMFNFGREDLFKKHIKDPNPWDQKSWEGHNGRHDLILYDPGQQIATLRRPDGSAWVFHTEGRPGSLVGHLTRIVSKNGNRIKFKYQSSTTQPDLLKRRLRSITESYGRKIVFVYDGNRVTSIRDFSGREVHYSYSAGGQLQSVRSPVVISTAGLNDFPEGKKTLYTYLNDPHALLKNALTSVVFPNQEAGGQEPRLVWQYNTDKQDRYFGYVESHTVGNLSASITLAAGGTYLYHYEHVSDNAELSGGVNAAAVLTTVLDRRSTPTTVELNRFGHPLQETIYTQGKRLGGAESYGRNFEYRETEAHHGDLSAVTHPIGNTYHHGHSEHQDQPPTSDGNQTDQEHPVDLRGGDQDVLRSEVVYEPIFNRPFKTISPRGFEPGRDPDAFTTLYIFDYMEDLSAALDEFAPKLGIEKAELQSLFDDAGITGFATDQNRDGKQDQSNGNVIAIRYPLVQLPDQAVDLGLNTTQEASEIFQYNDFGQLTRHWDTEENVTDYEYFGANDPDGDGDIDFPLKDPTSGGFLKRVIRDAIAYPGRNSDQNPDPVVQETRYEYTAQGSFPANLRGIRTAELDPRGVRHIYLVNELDQVVKTVRASADHAFETITIYDRNDNVVERRVQNKDTLDPGEDDFIVGHTTYDILDQKTSETHDVGGLAIVDTYAYDSSQNLIERVRGKNTAQESTESFEYDERDILITSTRGAGSTEQSTHTSEIDDNGNIVRTIDAEGGHQTQTIYDGFDRPWRRIDRLGNQEYLTYDSSGNVVSVERQDASGVRLSQTDRHYDERNRVFRVDEHIFHYPGQEVGDIDDGDLDPGDGRVSTVTIYDRSGRVVGAVNACAQTTQTRYDGLGRVLRSIDSLDNLTDHEYDANGNLIKTTATEQSSLVGNEVFEESFTYDSLNRRLTSVEPNGQTTRFTYDSRGNRIKTIDALGNQVEYRYDRLSRLVDTRKYLSVDGTGASASNKDLAQGGGDGVITLLQSWDPLNRLVAQTDDNGNTTAYTYDDLDRRIARGYADGTSETWTYNGDSELITHTTPNGSVETWTRDAEGRATRVVIQDPGASIPGTTEKTWAYDGLGRQVLATDNNIPHDAADDVRCEYIYDSLSRKIRETQTIGVMPALHVDTEWRGGHQEVSRTYPNGRVVERSYDDLDRLFEIREQGDSSLIARFEYVGPERDVRTTYGNGAVLDKRNFAGTQTTSGPGAGYDANRRHVRHEWQTSGGAQITAYVNTYNGPGGIGTNRRSSETREHLFGHTDTYGFDSAYRMLSFLRNGAVASARGLDGADKMLAFSDEGTDRMPVVDGDPGQEGMNQYSSFDGGGVTNRSYDASSALRAEAFDSDPLALEYVYDYADRLVEVRQGGGGLLARYTYAADNRRVLAFEAASAETLRYLYDGWQVVETRDVTGGGDTPRRLYVDGRGIDEHIQLLLLEEEPRENLGSPFYYHASSQGSVGALTDADQNVVEYYEYRWLGERLRLDSSKQMASPESAVGNPYGFQGRRHERGLPLCYYRNRYYNVVTGEFLTIDPKGNWNHEQGNGFSAFGEDGWNMADPFGLEYQFSSGVPVVFLDAYYKWESNKGYSDNNINYDSGALIPINNENSNIIYNSETIIQDKDNVIEWDPNDIVLYQDNILSYDEPYAVDQALSTNALGSGLGVYGDGSISIGNGVECYGNEVCPSIEVMHKLDYWFNDDVRLAVPSVSIPYGQRFISMPLAPIEDLMDLEASVRLGYKF